MARKLPDRGTAFLSRLDRLESHLNGTDDFDEKVKAALPGMWLPRKADFHAVNCVGTEIVIETARKRGIKRFLHCSTESILFRASPTLVPVADDALLPDEMPGPYTRSKMLADRFAMQAALRLSGVIGCPAHRQLSTMSLLRRRCSVFS
jgi:nucleoside-diphosphate-sugar epimerase